MSILKCVEKSGGYRYTGQVIAFGDKGWGMDWCRWKFMRIGLKYEEI